MKKTEPIVSKAIRSAADPARARRFFELLSEGDPAGLPVRLSAAHAENLAIVFGASPALGNLLVAHREWLGVLEPAALQFPRREQGLRKEVGSWLQPLIEAGDSAAALSRLREFKQKEMLRIAARDLTRAGNTPEIIQEISDVADVCLRGVWLVCRHRFSERFGRPWHPDPDRRWQPTEFALFGMGKLGGQELNYSSDVDVLFVYSEEGQVFRKPPMEDRTARPVMENHQFFNRFAEAFIAEISRLSPEGRLFRIDLRLRPEGESGPLTRSIGSYENYYAQWGQTWERMMLIKARAVAGDQGVASEFLEMAQPFRYPRILQRGVLQEIGAMKDRIEAEVLKADGLERNVKLGRGGIREIEFVAQALQLLHAGRQPFLQTSQTLPCLEKLSQYDLLARKDFRALRDAYVFLRDVEHRLQMQENLQTHTLPEKGPALDRLAKLMGFESGGKFEAARQTHTGEVRRIFAGLLKSEVPAADAGEFPHDFKESAVQWKSLLASHSFRDPDKALRMLQEFIDGPGYVHVSERTSDLARKLLPRLFSLCPKPEIPGRGAEHGKRKPPGAPESADGGGRSAARLSDPDRVMTRLDQFVSAYGARAVLFELWYSNPAIFELLVLLFDRSEFLAELAIRTPDMVDELVTSDRLRRRKTAEETLRDLRHGLKDKDQRLWLRRYHQTELMRIGLRDILGLADFEHYLQELSVLADACLNYAVEVVMRRHKLAAPPFTILGLGKLGGREIDYGSDLDIIFVTDSQSRNLTRLGRIALEVMDLVSARTEAGIVFHTDARLRPDGEKGLLVNTLAAYREYYMGRAQLWEIQSLTRVRAVAGDAQLGRGFEEMAAELTDFSVIGRRAGAASTKGKSKASGTGGLGLPQCVTPDWKRQIDRMRLRIEKERTPPGKDDLAIKTGRGGLMDAEFVAQALCLEKGWREANTLRALERGQASGALEDAEGLIVNYRMLRRVEGILRRWSYEGETVLPDDSPAYYRVSVRCGFADPGAFRQALARWRKAIRESYAAVFRE